MEGIFYNDSLYCLSVELYSPCQVFGEFVTQLKNKTGKWHGLTGADHTPRYLCFEIVLTVPVSLFLVTRPLLI